jgi:lipoprotein signal peptidase
LNLDLFQLVSAGAPALGGFGDIWGHIVADFSNITQPAAFAAFVQVLLIDLVLAGDNAIVVGALAAGLPAEQRRRVIIIGVVAALVLRIIFALAVTQLLQIVGLILAGGLGNLYDRMVYGAVRDFLHMLPGWELPNGWMWPGNSTTDVFPWVFNVADVLLLAGMALFVITSFAEDRRARLLATAAADRPKA